MKSKIVIFLLLTSTVFSCEFNRSINVDLDTGLTTEGNVLSCDDVSITINQDVVKRNSFIYAEKVSLNFNNIKGFKKENNHVFPGMELFLLNKKGDTIMYSEDLYSKNESGFNMSPLLLKSSITVANPLHSNEEYTAFINIWDKKGKGTFKAELDFDVIENKHIKIENKAITYNEIYLINKNKISISKNKIKFNENVYLVFEGLDGFTQEEGMSNIGLSLKVNDAMGKAIINEEDLIGDKPIEAKVIHDELAPNFIITGNTVKNPLLCEVIIWDKKSDKNIKTTISFNVTE